MSTGESIQGGLQEVLRHVIIERPFVVAHRVLVEAASALRERPIEKLLCLTAQRPLEYRRQPPLQFVLLAGDQGSVVFATEHLAERRNVPEQSARRFHILHEAP